MPSASLTSPLSGVLATLLISYLQFLQQLPSVSSLRIASPFHPAPPPPKIWLSEYCGDDSYTGAPAPKQFQSLPEFQTDYISKNRSDFIIQEDVSFVVFACKAKYPIQWTVPHPMHVVKLTPDVISTVTLRYSVFSPELPSPTNKYFKSLLIFYSQRNDFVSINFTCASIPSPRRKLSLQSSIHLFVATRNVLENQEETLHIPANAPEDAFNPHLKSLVLPCRPSLPDTIVTLFKQVNDDWLPVPHKYFSFAPKIGFTLSKYGRGKKLLGLYKCIVNGSDVGRDTDPFLLLSVTSVTGPSLELQTFQPHLNLSGNASIDFEGGDFRDEFVCCSGIADESPQIDHEMCESQLQCEVIKMTVSSKSYKNDNYFREINSNCTTRYLFGSQMILRCHGKNVDYAAELAFLFRPGLANVENRTQSWNQTRSLEEFEGFSFTTVVDISRAKMAPVEQKMLVVVGRPSTRDHEENFCSEHRCAIFPGRDLLNSSLIFANPYEPYLEAKLTLEYPRNFYYESEPLQMICLGLRHSYSEGVQVCLNWKNGSRTIIEQQTPREPERYIHLQGSTYSNYGPSSTEMLAFIGKEVKASLDMKSVDCFMPVWNGASWDRLSYALTVLPSIPPKFAGEAEELIYFHLNDTDKEISCEVLEGLPKPEVNLTKDGKVLSSEQYEELSFEVQERNSTQNGQNAGIRIKLKSVTYETHGIYRCEARNVKGTAVKVIKVVITGKRSIALPLSFVCLSVLSVLLLAIGFKYRLQLMRMWRLRNASFEFK